MSELQKIDNPDLGATRRTYDQLLEDNQRLRQKNRNYSRSMKQLQRAHVVTLYAKDRAVSMANEQAAYINELLAQITELHYELRQSQSISIDRKYAARAAQLELKELNAKKTIFFPDGSVPSEATHVHSGSASEAGSSDRAHQGSSAGDSRV